MIVRENNIEIKDEIIHDFCKESVYFDLEHYVYKKPVCIGVFGCCYYEEKENMLKVTQYMIENKKDAIEVLDYAKDYFEKMLDLRKKYIVTFSGNNDFTVINHLFKKYNIEFSIQDKFQSVDLQKEYEKVSKKVIGLKALEKEFDIHRDESELIGGATLAKTFSKIIKDSGYIYRMPDEKKEKIQLYNEQDVVSLFFMHNNWNEIMKSDIKK